MHGVDVEHFCILGQSGMEEHDVLLLPSPFWRARPMNPSNGIVLSFFQVRAIPPTGFSCILQAELQGRRAMLVVVVVAPRSVESPAQRRLCTE